VSRGVIGERRAMVPLRAKVRHARVETTSRRLL